MNDGKPVFTASEREKALFPGPAIPVTTTRRPIVEGASPIDFSVPHVSVGGHPGRRWLNVVGATRSCVVGKNVDRPSATKHAPQPCCASGIRTFPAGCYTQNPASV